MIQPPPVESVPDAIGKAITEYRELNAKLGEERDRRDALIAGRDRAQLDDANALAQAARSGQDVSKVGTPATTKLHQDIEVQQIVVRGFEQAVAASEAEVKAAIKRTSPECIAMAIAEAQRLATPYLEAISQVQAAAQAYDRALYNLAGWAAFTNSRDHDISFGNGGSIPIRSNEWLEPVNVTELTGTLRKHAGRHIDVQTTLGKADRERAQEASDQAANALRLSPNPIRMPEPQFDDVTGQEIHVGL